MEDTDLQKADLPQSMLGRVDGHLSQGGSDHIGHSRTGWQSF